MASTDSGSLAISDDHPESLRFPSGTPLFTVSDISDSSPCALRDTPHPRDAMEIVYVVEGKGFHVVDTGPSPIVPPQIMVLAAGQRHGWWEAQGVRGTAILFNAAFLDRPNQATREIDEILVFGTGPLTVDSERAARIERILHAMAAESGAQELSQDVVLHSLLAVVLIECESPRVSWRA